MHLIARKIVYLYYLYIVCCYFYSICYEFQRLQAHQMDAMSFLQMPMPQAFLQQPGSFQAWAQPDASVADYAGHGTMQQGFETLSPFAMYGRY